MGIIVFPAGEYILRKRKNTNAMRIYYVLPHPIKTHIYNTIAGKEQEFHPYFIIAMRIFREVRKKRAKVCPSGMKIPGRARCNCLYGN